jgi:hypothetical protein
MDMLKAQAPEDDGETYISENGGSYNNLLEAQEKSPPKKGLHRVRSGSNLAALKVEQESGEDIQTKQQKFQKAIGSASGFDLSQISKHYQHRRKLR